MLLKFDTSSLIERVAINFLIYKMLTCHLASFYVHGQPQSKIKEQNTSINIIDDSVCYAIACTLRYCT